MQRLSSGQRLRESVGAAGVFSVKSERSFERKRDTQRQRSRPDEGEQIKTQLTFPEAPEESASTSVCLS